MTIRNSVVRRIAYAQRTGLLKQEPVLAPQPLTSSAPAKINPWFTTLAHIQVNSLHVPCMVPLLVGRQKRDHRILALPIQSNLAMRGSNPGRGSYNPNMREHVKFAEVAHA